MVMIGKPWFWSIAFTPISTVMQIRPTRAINAFEGLKVMARLVLLAFQMTSNIRRILRLSFRVLRRQFGLVGLSCLVPVSVNADCSASKSCAT